MTKTQFGVDHKKWRPIGFHMVLTTTGGLLGKQIEAVEARTHGPTNTRYVKLVKSSRWLQRIVTGATTGRCLAQTTLLEDLTKKSAECSPGDGSGSSDSLMDSLEFDEPILAAPVAKRA